MKKTTESHYLQLILFTLGTRRLAVETQFLSEVLEPVSVTPLPFVPDYVDGLINISGQIIPQLDAAPLILGESATDGVHTLLIIEADGVPIALRVDQVLEPVDASPESIQPVKKNQKKQSTQSVAPEYLQGVLTINSQEVWLLNAPALKTVIKADKKAPGKRGFLGEVKDTAQQDVENFYDFLVIHVAGKDYALSLEAVHEIVDLESLSPQPRAPETVAGISLIRSEPRLILNLARLMNLPDSGAGGQTAIMVQAGDFFAGLLIDELLGLESISENNIKFSKDKKRSTLLREGGRTITPLIKPEELLKKHLKAISPFMPAMRKGNNERLVRYEELLRFLVNGDAYALKIASVKWVMTDKHIEPILKPHAYIMGTTELEGKVVPVIDLIAQLGYQSRLDEIQEFIVVNDGNDDWALAIYCSDQIMAVDELAIDWIRDKSAHYVSGFANDQGSLLTILDPIAICKDNRQKRAG